MSKLLNNFIGAAVLAGLTACNSNPIKETTVLTTPSKPTLSQEESANLLANARFVADVTAKNAVRFMTTTDTFAKLAKAKKVDQDICKLSYDEDAVTFTSKLHATYSATLSDEIKYGGELESEKAHRLVPIQNIAKQIDKNLEIIKDACTLKFGA